MKREPRWMLWLCKALGVALPTDGAKRSFGLNWALYGIEFGVVWGALMVLLDAAMGVERSAATVVLTALLGGLSFGLLMAWARRRS